MRARVALEPAYVLRTQPYGDNSLIVEAFTRGFGRVGLIAKGARAVKSKSRAVLQVLHPLLLSWLESSDLGTLTAAEAAGQSSPLAGEAIFSGWYVNELLVKLTQRHDPHPALFECYTQTLAALAASPLALEPALRRFEKLLLAELGYGLELPDDLDAAGRYRFAPDTGLVAAAADDRGAIPGSSLIALRDDALADAQSLRDARTILRAALAGALDGRVLETPKILRQLRARAMPPSRN